MWKYSEIVCILKVLINKELQNYFAMIADDKVIEIYSLADG